MAAAISLMAAAVAAYVTLLASVFRRAPTLTDQRWFARVSLTVAAFTACNVVTNSPDAGWPLVTAFFRVQFFLGAAHVASWFHYASAQTRTPSRADRPLALGLVALGILSLVPGLAITPEFTVYEYPPLGSIYRNGGTTLFGDVVLASFSAGLLLVLVRFARAARRGAPHALLHAVAVGLFLACVVSDSLVFAGLYQAPYLVDLGFLIPVAAGAYALGARVVEDAWALEDLRGGLQRQVDERTRALAESEASRFRAEKLAALGQLSAGVAHEVNNPTAILAANVQFLESRLAGGAEPEILESLRESRRAVERVARLVRQLLDSSRLAGAADQPRAPVAVAKVVAEAVRIAGVRTGSARVEVEVPDDLFALGQEDLLVQVVVNLVVNGAEAVPPGRPGKVVVRGARAGDLVRILVDDDGAGMEPDVLRRAFEPFFSTKPFGEGTGLGLAVSRGLVQGMGGDLRLESRVGVGTRALVELLAAPAGVAVPVSGASGAEPEGTRRRLLLVDDDPAVRSSLRRVLEARYDVTVASGADDAIALARTGRFEVVLCDVMMPDGGAERVAAALDREAPDAGRRLVFLTGGATTPAAREFLASEPRPILAKPLDLAELTRVAEGLARRGSPSPGERR